MTSRDGRPADPGPARPASFFFAELGLLALAVIILSLPALLRRGEALPIPIVEEPRAHPFLVPINEAPWHQWTLLEGIGEARARRIVALREERGSFRSIEELEELPGLPRGWVEKARPYLVLEPGE